MIDLECDKSLKELRLTVNKALVLKSIQTLGPINMDFFQSFDSLLINLEDTEEIDINGIQFILYCLHVKKWEKTELSPVTNPKMLEILLQTGFQILSKRSANG
jgi:hypothetical protein